MKDGVRNLLDDAVAWYEPPDHLLDRARRRMERRRVRRRMTAGAIGLVVSLFGVVLVWQAFRSADGGQLTGASIANYVFSQVAAGPALDPDTGEPIPDLALVEFAATWSSLEYPGVHSCRSSVYDTQGTAVGSKVFEFDSMQPMMRGGLEIPVDGNPARANARCEIVRLDTPVPYLISNAAAEVHERGAIAAVFDVAWPEGVRPGSYPGVNACDVRVLSEAGGVLARDAFTLSVGEGRVVQPVRLSGAELQAVSAGGQRDLTASVECEPWTADDLKMVLTRIPHPGDQPVIGPGIVLATGEVDATPWKLVAYQSDSGLCVDLRIEHGAGGFCSAGIDRHLVLGQASITGLDKMIVHGMVSERVTAVEVRPVEGDPVAARFVPDPGELGVNFFVLFVPRDALGEIVAFDSAGDILETRRLRPLEP